jgi:hypothetical protein
VVSELEFINEFKKGPGHHYWQTIDYIQTTIKIKALAGLGKPFCFTFNAPCFKHYEKRSRRPPKNIHPCAKDDVSDEEEDITNPNPILVENTYDGKIEFNYE